MWSSKAHGVIGIGYEGRDLDTFITHLQACHVTRLIDVRLNPISRKRGFSKSALRSALAEAGIDYEHRRELGNPKNNRAGFYGTEPELQHAKLAYQDLLLTTEAELSIREIATLADEERVALLCFEADEHRCHRDVLLDMIARQFEQSTATS